MTSAPATRGCTTEQLGEQRPFGYDQIIPAADGLAVGGAGFKGLPRGGSVGVGHGLAPSARGHGYVTEALTAMLTLAANHGVETVLADTTDDNIASQRILNGQLLVARGRARALSAAGHERPVWARGPGKVRKLPQTAGWLPERSFHLHADGAYATLVGADLPRTVVTSRMRRDAALYEPAPPRTGKRITDALLNTLAEAA